MGSGITVRKLFQPFDVELKGNKDVEITGICAHSSFVAPGNLFIAKKGKTFDATAFIPDVVDVGAVAVLTDLYNPFLQNVTQIIHPHPEKIEAAIANHYFQFPSKELFLVGITGTNGKTTTAYILKHLLEKQKAPCGLLGTIESIIGSHRIPAQLTTADVVSNHKFLREMCEQGCTSAVMEMTSHALDQGRADEIAFDLAIFTNLSRDHLDYHQTMNHYLQCKAKLFEMCQEKVLVNSDDPATPQLLQKCQAEVFTYGKSPSSDFRITAASTSLKGSTFTLNYKKQSIKFHMPLIGMFNIFNAAAAVSAAFLHGETFKEIQKKLINLPPIPGRLELIPNALDLHLFVDFAHTDAALEKTLELLSSFKTQKIITIFGCGGNRDAGKRPEMGHVAERYSDHVIVTSDNPRSEDPYAICKEVARGVKNKGKLLVEVDRYQAIEKGIALAKAGDIVLIAGRGHEPFQKIGGRLIPFDDRTIAKEVCNLSTEMVK